MKKAEDDPSIFLDCGYVVKVESDHIGVADKWFCCKCGQAGTEEPGIAASHAWGHLFGDTDKFGK
ncbi:MAG: hypothetical protein HY678_06010 [Chloroflexi bacterium]|nr:hypothetical protein [Chloroflexota bacterium]